MKTHEVKKISKRFRFIKEVPDWLRHPLPISDQISLIREGFGMTQEQLAERIGSHQHFIAQVENARDRDFQLGTLEKIADGLECELLVAFVPKRKMEKILDEKSLEAARKLMVILSGNAAMELQLPKQSFIEEQVKNLQDEILKRHTSSLWES